MAARSPSRSPWDPLLPDRVQDLHALPDRPLLALTVEKQTATDCLLLTVNMRSYGDKPPEFLRKVPSGLLPVLELDGQFITESLVIMQVLDDTFADGHPNRMIPPKDSPLFDEANRLLGLERKLFGAWCSFLFRPGGLLGDGRREFESQLTVVRRGADGSLRWN